jgi:hypothetical protein
MLNLIISGIVLIETNPAILFSTRHKKTLSLANTAWKRVLNVS